MAEYIDREAALNILCRENCGHDYEAGKCNNCYASSFIAYIPAADVAPAKHGKWVWKEEVGEDEYIKICSNCQKECHGFYDEDEDEVYYIRSDYCPNCGAKMDLEE